VNLRLRGKDQDLIRKRKNCSLKHKLYSQVPKKQGTEGIKGQGKPWEGAIQEKNEAPDEKESASSRNIITLGINEKEQEAFEFIPYGATTREL